MADLPVILPDWPAPACVKALQTTRLGGVSQGIYASLNLGDHVKDLPQHVAANRQLLSPYLPSEPVWLNQVHGVRVIDAALSSCLESADASFSTRKQVVCVTMTADCLPVLLCDQAGSVVAAVHAGWRSLCDGVIEATVKAMPVEPARLMAWLGPAIGPQAFEVGSEVRAQFMAQDEQAEHAFQAHGEKWLGDMYTIARQRLSRLGVTQVYGGGRCTYREPETFFSFRRDGDTGRMASLIWLE
ncbi:peptidoglycan editing factor PgeF [Methylophilus sp. VKM B-3414]|uniref:peptidoglycan editing factor PgeF n=1 Tax=Methylophilus sp. VKM B-3414 TaxID=3076121 RepID=UPI0028CA8458|nr:peptidoglycan editing factor PgeF [Methylophilus sp. VKM B-3414]MDT7850066.1 peptidoglycan editing factor PgeF [Methylophilus sp. VKM B-3414]